MTLRITTIQVGYVTRSHVWLTLCLVLQFRRSRVLFVCTFWGCILSNCCPYFLLSSHTTRACMIFCLKIAHLRAISWFKRHSSHREHRCNQTQKRFSYFSGLNSLDLRLTTFATIRNSTAVTFLKYWTLSKVLSMLLPFSPAMVGPGWEHPWRNLCFSGAQSKFRTSLTTDSSKIQPLRSKCIWKNNAPILKSLLCWVSRYASVFFYCIPARVFVL